MSRSLALITGSVVVAFLTGCAGGPSGSPGPAGRSPAGRSPTTAATDRPGAALEIDLGGGGPLGIAVVDTTAFVVLEAAGELVTVDLQRGEVVDRLAIGSGAMLVDANVERVVIGRYAAPDGNGLLVMGRGGREVRGVATPELAGLSLNGLDRAWALGSAGEVLMVDLAARQVTDRGAIEVNELEHLNGIASGGSFFASSDTTPVRRLEVDGSGTPLETHVIETGGGIPFTVDGGLVWGARADELWAVDPATNEVRRRIPLTGLIEVLALDVDVARGEAWIAGRRPGQVGVVMDVDLASGDLRSEHATRLPAGVAIVGGRVWVTDYEADALLGFER